MSGGDDGYTLKEVIEKNFADLKSEMRTGFSEIKSETKEIRHTADTAMDLSRNANRRLDTYDKHIWAIWTLILAGVVKLAFDFFKG